MPSVHHLIDLLHAGAAGHSSPQLHVMHLVAALVIYIIGCRLVMRQFQGGWREVMLAAFNMGGVYGFLFYGRQTHFNGMFLLYVGLVCFQYAMLWAFSERKGVLPWLAFFTPIAALIFVRYAPIMRLGQVHGFAWITGRGMGLVKYQFIGGLCSQLDYSNLLLDDHPHPWMELLVAVVFYYLFLYCNFSGFCDMAIGTAALIGISVPENFEDPFAARNMKEFWNRWHITLSQWMRDVVFAPLSKYLVRVAGPQNANHAVAIAVAVVFFLIGIWHGVGWNYALFGLAQSLGVVMVHYYTIFLKKRLGREGFKAYNENRWIYAAAVMVTFCYYAVTLFFFANTVPQMKQIFSILR